MSEAKQTMETKELFTIVLDDGSEYVCEAKRFVTIKNLLDDIDDEDENPLPVPGISKEIFELVIKFMELHPSEEDIKNSTEEGQQELRVNCLEQKDIDFFKMELKIIFELILAANYLDFKLLLEYSCKNIAEMIKGKKPDEIKKVFGVEGDFTEEEKDQVITDNPWLDDKDNSADGGGAAAKKSVSMEITLDGATEESGGGGAAE